MSLRNFNVPKLSFSKRYFLLPIILIVFFLLFYLVYNDIKDQTINEFNNEQLIIAQAASQGIASFFQNYQNDLTFLSQNKLIIDFNDDSRALMEGFYNNHKNFIEAVTRVDARGKILYTSPFNKSVIGQDISFQKHVHQILTTHQPVISDVFMSVQGYLAVALHVPVFKGKEFNGSLAILIQIDKLGKLYFEEIKNRGTNYKWLLSENGIEIYCPIKGHKGQSLLEITHNDSSAIGLMDKLKRENKGTTKSIHPEGSVDGHTKFIEKYITYYRVPLVNTFWTILVSYNEEEIYAALTSFRNSLIIIFSFLFMVMAYYFYSLTKVRTVLKEEKKRKETEKTLHESEEIFRRFMDHSPIYVFFKDENIRSLRLSKNYETMLGKPLDELLGKNMDELFPSDLAKSMVADDKRILKEGKEIIVEEKLNGRFYSTIKFPIFIEGKSRFLAGYTIDITENKQAEETLQMWGNVFTNAGWGVSVSNKDGQYLEMMNPRFAEMHGFSIDELKGQPILSLYPPNVHEDFLNQIKIAHERGHHLFESYHLRKDGTSFPVIIDVTVVKDPEGDAFYRIVNVQDITERKRAEDALRESEFQLSQLWAATVEGIVIHDQGIIIEVNDAMCRLFGVSREKVIGKSILDFATAETRDRLKKDFASESYGISEVTAIRSDGTTLTLEVLTRQIFYQGKNLRIAASRDITEHKQAEEALRRSEEDYRKLFENHSAVKLIVDPETGTIFDVNHAAAEYYGWTREEMKKMKINEINIFSSEEIQNAMKKARDSKQAYFEFKHKRADGSIRDVDVYSHITTMAGKEYLHSIIMDITERKRAEIVLQEEQSLSNSILNSLPGIVYIFDENGKFLRWNKNFEKASGYSYEEITERHPSDFFAGDEKELVLRRIQDVFIKGEANVEAYFISKKGKGTPHFFTGAKIEIKGKPMLIGMGIDITERKQAEEALRKSEKLFRVAFDNAPTGMSIIGSDGFNYLAVNPLLCKMFGYTKEEFMGNTVQLVTHPDDEERSNEWIRKKYNDEPCESDFEKRYIHKNGHIVWGLIRAQWIKNDDGSNLMAITHILDITKRKLAEEAVKKSEKKYRSIFENIQDVYYETLVDGKILEISPAIEIISKGQYHREDLIGKSMYEFYPDANERDSLIATMKRTGSVAGFEVRLRNRDGSIIHCSISAKLSINSNGQIEKIIGSMHDISERKRVEEALQENETRMRDIIFSVGEWVWEVNQNGIYTYSSKKGEDILGYSMEEIIGKTPFDFMPTDEAERVKNVFFEIMLKKAPIKEVENWNLRKNGEKICLVTNGVPVLDENGNLKGYRGVDKDITKRKLTEAALVESESKFRAVIEEAVEIVFTVNNRGYFTYINPAGIKSSGFSNDELTKLKYIDLVEPEYKQRVKSHYIDQYRERISVSTTEYPFRTKLGEIKWFNQNARLIIENDQIKGFYVIARDVTERRKAEEALQERETRYRNLFSLSPSGILLMDTYGIIIDTNESFCKSVLYTRDELIGKNIRVVVPEQRHSDVKDHIQKIQSGIILEHIVQNVKKDGTLCDMELRESLVLLPDGRKGILTTANDITERKRAEEALRESEEKYRLIVENSNDGIEITQDDVFIYSNIQFAEMLGYTLEELKDMEFSQILSEQAISELYERERRRQDGELGSSHQYETTFVKKEGGIIHVGVKYEIIDYNGKPATFATIQDITERKLAEKALRNNELQLRNIFEHSTNLFYSHDINHVLKYISPQVKNILGYEVEEALIKWTEFASDNPINESGFQKTIKAIETGNAQEPYELELVHKNGKKIFVEVREAPLVENGKTTAIVGSLDDITERKLIEEALKESENKFRTVIEEAVEIVFTVDNRGYFTYVNPAGIKSTGYSFDELNKIKYIDLVETKYKQKAKFSFFRQFKEKRAVATEDFPICTKSGEIKWFNQNVRLIIENDEVKGFYVISRDITERRKAEEALQEKENQMRMIVEGTPQLFFYTQDTQANVTYISPSVKNITGYSVEQWLNQSHWFVTENKINEEAKEKTHAHLRGVLTEGPILLEVEHADKHPILLEVYESPIIENKKIIGLYGVAHDITERKHAEDLVRKSQEDLVKFFEDDLSADYISTPSGRLLNCNKTYLKVFGFNSKEEALSFPLEKIYPNSSSRKEFITLLKKRRRLENFESEYISLKGVPIYAIETSVAEFDNVGELVQIRGYIVDITERKKAEEELIKLSRAVEQSPASVIITNKNGDIEYVNKKFCDVTGYFKEEVIGKNPRILNSGYHDKYFYMDLWSTILEGENWEGEMRNKKKNGDLYWESVLISPLVNSEGSINHFVAVKEDITEKKFMIEELIQAKDKAEQSNKLKDAFIANMSHEIRTPLNGILGLSSIIKGLYAEHIKEDEESIFSGIEHSSKRIIRTVDMILNYSRIQTGEFPINPIQIELSLICENLVKEFTITAKNRLLDLSFENRIGKAISMFGDEYSVTHAISNLIDNAIKYTDKGFIKVILYSGKDDEILLDITDSGIGISKEYLTNIFQPYQQEHIGYGRAYEGIGLGLSMVKKFLNLNKADIFVESEKGKGTRFTINFGNTLQPLAIKMADKKPNKIITEQVKHKKPLVLLVEDDAFNQTAIKIFIEKGYDTIITDSSEGALDIMENNRVDLILMDISIKGSKNGLELTKEFKASKKYSHIPVIAITAHAFEKDKQNAFEAGCDDYLSKPFSKDLLLEIIGKYF